MSIYLFDYVTWYYSFRIHLLLLFIYYYRSVLYSSNKCMAIVRILQTCYVRGFISFYRECTKCFDIYTFNRLGEI